MPPHPSSPKSKLILFTNLRLDLPSCHFPSSFPTNNIYTFIFSLIRATCPDHLILLYLIILIILGEEYKVCSSSLCIFRHLPVNHTSFQMFSTPCFQITTVLCSSLSVRDQVSHPHRTTGNIIVSVHYILYLSRK
jgi:hypothetical protein